MQQQRFQGKSAIITGAATLIGAAVCKRLIADGAQVTLADIDPAGQEVAEQLGEHASFVVTDVTDEVSIARCVEDAVRHGGGVNILVNIASTYLDGGLHANQADWLNSYAVNVVGGVQMLRAVVPHMQEGNGGAVVNFSSISAERAQQGRWLYPATKAAIRQVTRSAAMDLAADRIRVNSISPGWVWSRPIAARSKNNRDYANKVAEPLTMNQRLGTPDEIAHVVAFLCSDEASYITGADIAADGGYLAMGPEQATDPWSLIDLPTREEGI